MYGPAVPWPLLPVSHRICTAVLNDNTFIKPPKYVLILKCIKCKRARKEEKHFCNLLFADLPYFYSKHESNIIHGNTSSALLNSSLFLYIYFAPSYFLPLKFCNVHKQTAMRKKKNDKNGTHKKAGNRNDLCHSFDSILHISLLVAKVFFLLHFQATVDGNMNKIVWCLMNLTETF